jgi:8-oxo-dGTP pyrophosphatase MutT (NUDIX family)
MKQATLCYLIQDDKVLLGKKKRGFGVGKWNGIGGKVKRDEDITDSAIRELEEEIAVRVSRDDMVPMGVLHFRSINTEYNWDCSLFLIRNWTGEPSESEEIYPQWYPQDAIPYDLMWSDDIHWFPLLLSGKQIRGEFILDADGKDTIEHSTEEIP